MRKIFIATAAVFSLVCLAPVATVLAVEPENKVINAHRIGLGVNYWKTVDNISQEFDSDGLSYLASYQYVPVWYFKVEADMELFPDLANSSSPVVAPELFLTVGGLLYAGVGVGIYYHEGDWGNAPFYMLRAGVDIPVLPRLFLDINANYRFNDWDSVSWNTTGNPGTDTIRLGATLRFTL